MGPHGCPLSYRRDVNRRCSFGHFANHFPGIRFPVPHAFYTYTTRTGPDAKLSLSSSLSPGHAYHYQVEAGTQRSVKATGTFSTAR